MKTKQLFVSRKMGLTKLPEEAVIYQTVINDYNDNPGSIYFERLNDGSIKYVDYKGGRYLKIQPCFYDLIKNVQLPFDIIQVLHIRGASEYYIFEKLENKNTNG